MQPLTNLMLKKVIKLHLVVQSAVAFKIKLVIYTMF